VNRKVFRIVAFVLLGILYGGVGAKDPGGHYFFAWMGDADKKGEDFLAVVDANPSSPAFGSVVASVATGVQTQQVHHTEYWMPESGFLFANDHESGTTAIFDLRDPLHPAVRTRFGDLGGFSHPHSFLRLPNGHVLASFQVEGHMHHGADPDMDKKGAMTPMTDAGASKLGMHGGLVEIDDAGSVVRTASTADPSRPDGQLMAYSLLPLPDIDRVVVTNSSMRSEDRNGHTYQVFRLSDLKLLSTTDLDRGSGNYGELNPEEVRRGPDGAVYVQTLGCGIERITDIASQPHSHLVYQFPGSYCGVPTIVSHYLIQTVPIQHSVVVLDIAHGDAPVEVSRVQIDQQINPHWTAYDPVTQRIAISGYGENRVFLLTFTQDTGAIAVDTGFHDAQGHPGMDLADRAWPHGWKGTARAHGIVFSRQ
jgi:hypothetical protein